MMLLMYAMRVRTMRDMRDEVSLRVCSCSMPYAASHAPLCLSATQQEAPRCRCPCLDKAVVERQAMFVCHQQRLQASGGRCSAGLFQDYVTTRQ